MHNMEHFISSDVLLAKYTAHTFSVWLWESVLLLKVQEFMDIV